MDEQRYCTTRHTHEADTEEDQECLIPGYQLCVCQHYPEQALLVREEP